MRRLLLTTAAVAAVLTAQPASADTTWTLGSTPPAGLSIRGYANTGTGSGIEVQPLSTNTRWYSGGWGINNLDGCVSCSSGDRGDVPGSAPEHAIDNNQRHEMLLLTFTSAKILSKVGVGYVGYSDSDLTVMAYTGGALGTVPPSALVGATWASLALAGSGWTRVGNYDGNGAIGQRNINAAAIASSYWLIGAYNPLAAPGGSTTGVTLDSGDDYIKLLNVTSVTPVTPSSSVSEPGTMALLGLGLLGVGLARRRTAPTH